MKVKQRVIVWLIRRWVKGIVKKHRQVINEDRALLGELVGVLRAVALGDEK